MSILARHIPNYRVWAFGSRVKGTAQPTSDLDLCVLGDQPLSHEARANLLTELSESDLPYPVDLVEWALTGDAFRTLIEREHLPLQNVD